jgi:death-on-curing family protein
MTNTITSNGKKIVTLNTDCIIELHRLLSENYKLMEDMEPIEPAGVKNIGMLESAVNRQQVGLGEQYKYDNVYLNTATLVFGIIKNHSFHNGNKRTGFLALIKHLYVNGYVLKPNLKHQLIYDFLIAIADSKLYEYAEKFKKEYKFLKIHKIRSKTEWKDENVVEFIAYWIKSNSTPKENTIKGEIKISLLRKLLDSKDIKIDQKGIKISVWIEKENKFLGLISTKNKINYREYSLKNSETVIDNKTLNKLRQDFKLTKKYGIDNRFFYDESAFLDNEIKIYKQIIYRLSKT